MSIYPPPKQHNGSLNSIFNRDDYIKDESSSSTGTTQAFNDGRYLKNTGVVVSSASTTFNSSVNIAGLATIDNLNAKKSTDALVSATFSASQTYSFLTGMVYTLASNSTTTTTLSITDIPTTPQQSYIFTFIIQPTTANSPYHIVPNTNFISVNTLSTPLYGLQNAILPKEFTYIVQQITVINTSTTTNPAFISFTSISGY